MIEALVLDYYGTLVHEDDAVISRTCVAIAATARAAVSPSEVASRWRTLFVAECQGTGDAFVSQRQAAQRSLGRVLDDLGSRQQANGFIEAQVEFWRAPPLFPETKAFLEEVDVPTCLLSNIDRCDLEASLDHHGLSFDHVVTSDDVRAYKPAPEMFWTALAVLEMGPDRALHVGDSLSADIAGAEAVDLPVVWLNRAGRERPASVRLLAEITSLQYLPELLAGRNEHDHD